MSRISKGTEFDFSTNTEQALRGAGLRPERVGRKQDHLRIPHMSTREAARILIEQELHTMSGYEQGTADVYEDGGRMRVLFFENRDANKALEFTFDPQGTILKATAFEGDLDQDIEVSSSALVQLAEKARAMYLSTSPDDNAVPPSVPKSLMAVAEPDDEFMQRLVAGRRLVVLANWSGTVPPAHIEDRILGKRVAGCVISNRQRVAEITASPSGLVEIARYRVAVEEDEHGIRRVAKQLDPEWGWRGPASSAPEKFRNAAAAAAAAAAQAVSDPTVVSQQVRWVDPEFPRREDKQNKETA